MRKTHRRAPKSQRRSKKSAASPGSRGTGGCITPRQRETVALALKDIATKLDTMNYWPLDFRNGTVQVSTFSFSDEVGPENEESFKLRVSNTVTERLPGAEISTYTVERDSEAGVDRARHQISSPLRRPNSHFLLQTQVGIIEVSRVP